MKTISIVSHGDDISIDSMIRNSNDEYFSDEYEIIIRENKFSNSYIFRKLVNKKHNIKLFFNNEIKGFGENHNLNFKESSKNSDWFIVCNPDLKEFPKIFDLKEYQDNNYNLISANILNKNGSKTDFMRSEISILKLFLRFLGFNQIGLAKKEDSKLWAPNVFMIFSRELFKEIKGYDENIFLYYEDYDICMRAKKYCKLIIKSDLIVKHIENRESKRNLRLFFTHLQSIIYVMLKNYK